MTDIFRHRNRALIKALTVLILPYIVLTAFVWLEKILLSKGILNKKDIGFVGDEKGTFYEYLTNVWYWDGFGFVLIATALTGTILGIILLLRIYMQKESEH